MKQLYSNFLKKELKKKKEEDYASSPGKNDMLTWTKELVESMKRNEQTVHRRQNKGLNDRLNVESKG